MLALCHVLVAEGLPTRASSTGTPWATRGSTGYVRGEADGVPKTPEWAAPLTGVAAERIRALAREMAASRTMVTVSWSLQRAEHGEQPVWLGLVLAAMLGQIGLPGGGFGHGYGSTSDVGQARRLFAPPAAPGRQRHRLLHPGGQDRGHAAAARHGIRLRRRSAAATRTSSWSTGAAGTRFTITRTSPGCARRSPGPRPWWCTTRSGPPPRGTPISSCPRTMSVERDDIGAGSGDSSCSPCRS